MEIFPFPRVFSTRLEFGKTKRTNLGRRRWSGSLLDIFHVRHVGRVKKLFPPVRILKFFLASFSEIPLSEVVFFWGGREEILARTRRRIKIKRRIHPRLTPRWKLLSCVFSSFASLRATGQETHLYPASIPSFGNLDDHFYFCVGGISNCVPQLFVPRFLFSERHKQVRRISPLGHNISSGEENQAAAFPINIRMSGGEIRISLVRSCTRRDKRQFFFFFSWGLCISILAGSSHNRQGRSYLVFDGCVWYLLHMLRIDSKGDRRAKGTFRSRQLLKIRKKRGTFGTWTDAHQRSRFPPS